MNLLGMRMPGDPVQSPHVYLKPSAPILLFHFLNFRMLTPRNLNSNTTQVVCIEGPGQVCP